MNTIIAWWERIRSQGGCLWILIGSGLGILVLLVFLLILPVLARSEAPALPAPIMTVVVFPSATPTPTITPSPTPAPEPTITATAPAAAGGFEIGQLVEIQGTEGEGLRLRQSAGLEGEIRLVALENEVFEISDGPVEQDGYLWWFLINPYDSSKRGWGVSNFIRSAEG